MSTTLYCSGCKIKVAMIQEGSKIKAGAVMICSSCERLRLISDLGRKSQKNDYGNFVDIFGDMFGGKI